MTTPTWDIGPAEDEMRGWLLRNRKEAKLGLFFLSFGFVLQLLAPLNLDLELVRVRLCNLFLNINWDAMEALGTILAVITASVAARVAYKTWKLEQLPVVHATGTFIISTKDQVTNQVRDEVIGKDSTIHTLQLVNVGRGPAKNVIPSVSRDVEGKFLEAINPHSFSLPANKGTKELGEVLRVHGQIFVRGNEYELEFENNRETGYFYIDFEDHSGKVYKTKVVVEKVKQADGEMEKLRKIPGIEIWKVMRNTSVGG